MSAGVPLSNDLIETVTPAQFIHIDRHQFDALRKQWSTVANWTADFTLARDGRIISYLVRVAGGRPFTVTRQYRDDNRVRALVAEIDGNAPISTECFYQGISEDMDSPAGEWLQRVAGTMGTGIQEFEPLQLLRAEIASISTACDFRTRHVTTILRGQNEELLRKTISKYDDDARVVRIYESLAPTNETVTPPEGYDHEGVQQDVSELVARAADGAIETEYVYDADGHCVEEVRSIEMLGVLERTTREFNARGHAEVERVCVPVPLSVDPESLGVGIDEALSLLREVPRHERLRAETKHTYNYDVRGSWAGRNSHTHAEGRKEDGVSTRDIRTITYY